ncbi:zinc ion-binding protein [Senna tora]|uniref:Zinc ion-binding protein n=1 Tax=Senna tora TaxID=362788 RepID=A0A834WZA9_9FABA|nr:zinc ion-binding protein [Senna tora]
MPKSTLSFTIVLRSHTCPNHRLPPWDRERERSPRELCPNRRLVSNRCSQISHLPKLSSSSVGPRKGEIAEKGREPFWFWLEPEHSGNQNQNRSGSTVQNQNGSSSQKSEPSGPPKGESNYEEAVEFDLIVYHNQYCPWVNGNIAAAGCASSVKEIGFNFFYGSYKNLGTSSPEFGQI